jgi:GT2 family glycosyltransferase
MSRNSLPPISLVIVNYNGEQYLREASRAVSDASDEFAEVILVDNASTDGSLSIVCEELPRARVVRLGRNYGPATARNVGFKAARHQHIMFIDCDVVLAPGCARLLASALGACPGAVAAMPAVVYKHDRDRVQYSGADSHFLGLMSLRDADVGVAELCGRQPQAIGSLVTCCFLLDRERWGDQPPFDASFFSLYEDHDFGLRSRVLGHRILSVPSARVYHGQGTEGLSIRRTGRYTSQRVFLLVRNRWQVVLKNYQARTLLSLLPVLMLYETFQLAVAFKKGWLGEWLRAVAWVVGHRQAIMRKRHAIQEARVLPDREILSGGPLPFTRYIATSPFERIGKRMLDFVAIGYWDVVARRLKPRATSTKSACADWGEVPLLGFRRHSLLLMHIHTITIVVTSRRPSIEIEGYTMRSPCGTGALYKASIGVKMWLKESAVGRTLQSVARDFNRRASAGDHDDLFVNLHRLQGERPKT